MARTRRSTSSARSTGRRSTTPSGRRRRSSPPLRLPWHRRRDLLVRRGGVSLQAETEDRVKAALEVFKEKLVKRNISLKSLDAGEPRARARRTRSTARSSRASSRTRPRRSARRSATRAPRAYRRRSRATSSASPARRGTTCRPSSPCSRGGLRHRPAVHQLPERRIVPRGMLESGHIVRPEKPEGQGRDSLAIAIQSTPASPPCGRARSPAPLRQPGVLCANEFATRAMVRSRSAGSVSSRSICRARSAASPSCDESRLLIDHDLRNSPGRRSDHRAPREKRLREHEAQPLGVAARHERGHRRRAELRWERMLRDEGRPRHRCIDPALRRERAKARLLGARTDDAQLARSRPAREGARTPR